MAQVADQVAAAEHFAARAFEAYGNKQYAEAVALYEQAYASAPSADALYNIARVYDLGLQDRERAVAVYERCLSEPGASLERLARASERLLVLRRSESASGESEPTPVQMGGTAAPPPAPSEPEPRASSSTLRVAALISGAAGLVSVGVGLGFGVAVLDDADQANVACVGNRCSTQQGVAAAESASTKATLATTGVLVGTTLLITSATLWLLDGQDDEERDATPGVSLTPVAGAGELGMALGGRW